MYKKIKQLRKHIIVASAILTVSAFGFSGLVFNKYLWLSNLLMGIGASFLASILFAVFSDATRKKYTIFSAEARAKKEAAFLYDSGILCGHAEMNRAYEARDFESVVNWGVYFYEKMLSTCRCFEGIQHHEGKLKKDADVASFISSAYAKYNEYLTLREKYHLPDSNRQVIAKAVLENINTCFEIYGKIQSSALHDSYELELANDRYHIN